jgi:hypothetical protein
LTVCCLLCDRLFLVMDFTSSCCDVSTLNSPSVLCTKECSIYTRSDRPSLCTRIVTITTSITSTTRAEQTCIS